MPRPRLGNGIGEATAMSAVACPALLPGVDAVAQPRNKRPVLLGPSGQPLPAAPPPPPAPPPPEEPPAPAEPKQPPAAETQAAESPSAPAESPKDAEAPARPSPPYQVRVALDADPRQVPATLVVLLPFDPTEAYRTRLEAARDQFFKSRDTLIASAEASLRAQGVNVNDPRRAAASMIERQFMAQVWDSAFSAVSGAQVGLVFAAALSGGEQAIGTMLVSPFDGGRMWVTSRATVLGDRFGAWAMPVQKRDAMPATAILNRDALAPLRMNFARIRV